MTHPKTAMEAWRKAQNERFYTGSDQAAASVLEAWKEEQVRELREALVTVRDYVADTAAGALVYSDSAEGLIAMAKEDLARIDTLLAGERGE